MTKNWIGMTASTEELQRFLQLLVLAGAIGPKEDYELWRDIVAANPEKRFTGAREP